MLKFGMRPRFANIILACLAPVLLLGLIAFGRDDQGKCVPALGLERARAEFYKAPHVIDVQEMDVDWRTDCSFTMTAVLAILDGASGSIRQGKVDAALDGATGRWNISPAEP